MFAVSDYQIDTHTLSNGVDVHVLLHPDEDPWVPVFQVCRGSNSFKRYRRKPDEYSESDMLKRVSDCNQDVVADPDRAYSTRLKKATLISFAGLAERAAHCDQPGYLAYWARFLYEVILPKYPGYVTAHAAEVQAWRAATMPLVFPAPPDAESVLVLLTPDHGGVVCHYRAGSRIAWGVRVKVPLSDGTGVARFLPTDSSRVVTLLDWLATNQGEELRLVPARVEDGRITLSDGTLIAGIPEVVEPAREATREDSEPPREDEREVDGVPDKVPQTPQVWKFLGLEFRYVDPNPDGKGIFVADLATVLGYRDAEHAARLLRPHQRGTRLAGTPPDGPQDYITCTIGGLFRIIVRSDRKGDWVEKFQDAVTDDWLPRLMMDGYVILPGAQFQNRGPAPGLTFEAFREIVRAELGQALLGHQECVAEQLSHFYSVLTERLARLTSDVDGWQHLALETTRVISDLIDQINTLGTVVDQVLDKVSARRPRFWRVKTGLRVLYGLSGKGLHEALAAIKDQDLRKKLYTANPGQVNNKLGRFCAELVKQDEQECRRRREAGDDKARQRFFRKTRVIGGHECNVYNSAVIRHLGGLIRSGGDAPPVIPIKEA